MPLVLTRRLQPLRGLLDLAPVVSVVLLLLCFFLLSSSFVLQPGIKIDPPPSVSALPTPSSRLIVIVALSPKLTDANGQVMTRHPVYYFNDQMMNLDELKQALDRLPTARVAPTLVLKADKEVPLDVLTGIIDVAHRFSIVIATQPNNFNSP